METLRSSHRQVKGRVETQRWHPKETHIDTLVVSGDNFFASRRNWRSEIENRDPSTLLG